MAYVSQFGFDLLPCTLCYYQRLPYAAVFGIGLVAMMTRTDGRRRRILVALMGLFFLLNAGVASFHVGVEQHWWTFESECSAAGTESLSAVDLMEAVKKPAVVRCDEPQWALFGITMAGYNAAASMGLALLVAFAIRRREWWI